MIVEHFLSSSADAPPLRVALLVDAGFAARAEAHAAVHVLRSGFARIVLLVREERPRPRPSPRAAPARLLALLADPRARSTVLFDLYEEWDRRRAGGAAGPGEALAALLAGVPSLDVPVAEEGELVRLPAEAVARLREHEVDVALRLAPGRLDADAASAARYGVWSLRLGDGEQYRGGPPHFWELAERNPVSGVSLEVTRPGLPPLVLCKAHAATATEHAELSLARNRARPHLLATTFVIRKLKQLHEEGFAALERDAVREAPYRGRRRTYRAPTNLEMAAFLVPRLAGKARLRLERPRLVQWRIGIRAGRPPPVDPARPLELEGFRWIEAPPGRLFADPCLVERRGQVWCFFEDLDHDRGLGRISCAAVTSDGRLEEVRPVLERPYHLSYPFVFEHAGDVFMVPESRRNGSVDLYRAVEFPGRWEKVRTLLDGPGLDTTVLRHGGRFWFFVAVREPEAAGEQLFLFHAAALDAPLRFHPRNPICADVRRCRPAGAILDHGGRLLRPAQDCSGTYGRQLAFSEILTLEPDAYREEPVHTVAPPPGMSGIHTYSRCGPVEVIDAKRLEPVARHVGRARERRA